MKIELIKKTKITGEIWYNIWIDGDCKKSFVTEDRAIEFYDEVVNKKIVEKSETLKSTEI